MINLRFLYIAVLMFFCGAAGVLPAFAAKDFNIRNAGTYYFTVKGADGNIGIGSASPGQKLDVNGTVRVTGNVGIGTTETSGARLVVVGGNVGIGTITATAPLSFGSSLGNTKLALWENSVGGRIGMGIQGAQFIFHLNAASDRYSFYNTAALASELMTIKGTGNVGIGSVTPGASLDIQGTARMTAFTLSTGAAAGYVLQTNSVGVGTWVSPAALATNTNDWTLSGTNVYTTTGSNNVGIGTSNPQGGLVVTNGNVGIGTWTPSNSLDVRGTIQASGNVAVQSGGVLTAGIGGGGRARPYSSSTTMQLTDFNGNGITVVDGGNVGIGTITAAGGNLIVGGSGNVGIGSAWPGVTLDVQGSIRASGTISGTLVPSTLEVTGQTILNTSSGNTGIGTTLTGGNTAKLAVIGGNVGVGTITPQGGFVVTNGNVGIGTWAPSTALSIQSGNIGIGSDVVSHAKLEITGNGAAELLRINPHGINDDLPIIVTAAGNIGVATTAPITALANTATIIKDSNNVNVSGYGLSWGNPANAGQGAYIAGISNPGSGTSRNVLLLKTGASVNDAYLIRGEANSIPVFNVNATGNVGLGSIAPQAKLSVVGNIGIGTVKDGDLFLSTSPPNGGMIVEGNVGIGSVTPGAPLDVQGTARMTAFTLSTGASSGYVLQTNSVGVGTWVSPAALATNTNDWTLSGTNVYTTTGSNNVGIGTTTPQGGLVVTNGNVGIGTWAPATSLDVQGVIKGTSATQFTGLTLSNGTNTTIKLFGNTASNDNGIIQLMNGGSTKLQLSAGNGSPSYFTVANVGIGTTTPQAPLASTGNVGIGTWTADGGRLIVQGGNVGIGSVTPGQALDVQGTARLVGLTLSTGASSGYVLQTNSVGVGTWVDAATLATSGGGWTASGTNVYTTTGSNNVGIGTTTPQGGLVVTNGNVGIGTWETSGGSLIINSGGNVGIATAYPEAALTVNGLIATDGSDTITSAPKTVKGALGWKIGLWGATYAIGMANFTVAHRVNGWVSVFSNLSPANNATIAYPDSNAVVSLGISGVGIFRTNIGIGTIGTANQFTVNGGVGIGTGNSSFVTTVAPSGGMIVQGNVGLGSLSPGTPLDVQGTVRATALTLTTGAASGYVLQTNSVGVGTWVDAATLAGSGSGWTASGTNVYTTTGSNNVGIGTTTPQGGLVVTNGNVGIGTWTAGGTLDIYNANGNIQTLRFLGQNNGGMAVVPVSDAGSQWSFDILSPLATGAAYAKFFRGTNTSGYVALIVNKGNGANDVNAAIGGNGNSYLNALTGNVGIGTDATGQVGKLAVIGGNVGIGTITPQGGLVVTNGNVGIGTWAPQGGLVVTNGNVGIGTNVPVDLLNVVGGAGASGITLKMVAGAGHYSSIYINDVSSTQPRGLNLVDNWAGIRFVVGNIGANVVERMRIDNNGNVGIGTNLPVNLLAVAGGVGIGTGANSPFVYTSAPAGGMIVQGNVGLGSLSPGTPLDVQGTVRATALTLTTGAASGYVLQTNSVGVGTWVDAATLATSGGGWTAAGTNVYTTTGSNNVGIGTTTPQGGLVVTNGKVGVGTWAPSGGLTSVRTTSYGTDASYAIHASDGVDPAKRLVLGYDDTVDAGVIASAYTGNPWKNTLINAPGGNVGIGTFALGSKLAVHGGMSVGRSYSVSTAPTDGLMVEGNVGIGTTTPQGGFVVTNGNVGIGTWAPVAPLDIASGNIKVAIGSGIVTPRASDGGLINMLSMSSGTNTTVINGGYGSGGATSVSIQFNVNGASAASILGGGNVGIGTTTPQGGFVVTNGNVGVGTWTAAGGSLIVGGGGNVGIGSAWPGATLDVQGSIRASGTISGTINPSTLEVTGQTSLNTSSGNTGIGTTLTGGNTARLAVIGGNVGIGTITPQGALVVTNGNVGIGTWAPPIPLLITVPSPTMSTPFIGLESAGGNNAYQGYLSAAAGGIFGIHGANAVVFSTAAGGLTFTERARFDSTGNFGIGTSTPQGGLVVTNGNVGIGTWAPTMPLVVDGNVGIGTNLSSAYQLSVYSTAAASMVNVKSTAGGSYLTLDRASVGVGNALNIYTAGTQDWAIGSANDNTKDLRVYKGAVTNNSVPNAYLSIMNANGNVGIGTTIPGNRLSVAGGVGIGTGLNSPYVGTAGPTGGLIVQGNVGVGTTTPQAAFVVTSGNVGLGTWTATSGLQLSNSFSWYRTTTAASVSSAGQTILGVTSTAAPRTITLATADTVVGRVMIIKDESGGAGTNNITVTTQAGQTIDGTGSIVISANYGVLRVYSDGSNWFTF